MKENSEASNVARAITVSLDWKSSAELRNGAFSYLESIKAGDVRALANISFVLVRTDWSSEIRLHAFKMLQHLVRLRWEELTILERRNFANIAIELLPEMATPSEEWALKSQTAALVAEIVRREGITLLQELLPSLVSLSEMGPIPAELVSMALRWLPEDITVHNEDLEGGRRRELLRGLTESLCTVFPVLYTLLERHFGAAMVEAGSHQLDIAKQHAATVTATLHAVNAYSEWAPLPDFAKYGLIHGCGFLLSSSDFRLHACEFFKLISPRKRPIDSSAEEFDSAMASIFRTLMNVSSDFLSRSLSVGAFDDNEIEFAELICESMVSLGSSNLQCISGDPTIISIYLQQMLGYFQHVKLALHFQSLVFWMALMRDLTSKSKVTPQASIENSSEADKGKKAVLVFINDDICSVILDVTFQRLLKRENVSSGKILCSSPLELWSDDFDDKGRFSHYRSRLLDLMKFIASQKPCLAAARVSDRIQTIIKSFLEAPMPNQDLAVIESMQMALEAVLTAIFDGSHEPSSDNSELQLALCRIFEGLLDQLLSLKWTEPPFAELLAHYLASFGTFLRYYPDAMGRVINKLFELLTSLPCTIKDPLTSRARHARLQICSSFVHISKAADKSFLPFMKEIADTMTYLDREGRLHRGEHNLLGEAVLVMASAAGFQQQQEVLAWLLEPLSKLWTQVEWQNSYLADSESFTRLFSDTHLTWSIYHSVMFFEKALKRSGMRKNHSNLQSDSAANINSVPSHPLASHLSWMLPPLIRLLRALHALWSEPVRQLLPSELKAAMSMNEIEQASLLGESNLKPFKGTTTQPDGLQNEMNNERTLDTTESDMRNWLKGIRDSGYTVLGLSTTVGDSFFKCLEINSVALALMEHIQSMEFRHIKQLVHLVIIPLIKFCPSDLWDEWLGKLLPLLLFHSEQALNYSWSALMQEGRAKVPDALGSLCGSDLKVELMEEKLLRNLTREICSLLSVLASPGSNDGHQSLEQLGHAGRVEMSSDKDLNAFASKHMVGFLLKNKGAANSALQICTKAFTWTDSESVSKLCSFCGSLVQFAVYTNNAELQQFVANDLFCAIIEGLALESNATISGDLVGFCREIFVYLADNNPSPRQILLSLPSITPHCLSAFEESLRQTSSPKDQKLHMKNLLLLAAGSKLKALAAQKSTNVITNVTVRTRHSTLAPETSKEKDGLVGLAAIM